MITVPKKELLELLAEMNNGALELPPTGLRRMMQFGDTCQPFELYVNNLMSRVSAMIESNGAEQLLPRKLLPIRIIVDKIK
jgi:hypothetical protein